MTQCNGRNRREVPLGDLDHGYLPDKKSGADVNMSKTSVAIKLTKKRDEIVLCMAALLDKYAE